MSQRSSDAASDLTKPDEPGFRPLDDIRTSPTPISGSGNAPESKPPSEDDSAVFERLGKLEKANRLLTYGVLLLAGVCAYLTLGRLVTEDVIVQQKLMESKELKLIDSEGNPRLFLRMFSRVPVLQVLDANAKPRMSLGLRFDDTPFIDLSDRTGRTRATFEMTEDDAPALRLFDENGRTTFNIN